jgi:hypothetical protein
MLQDGQEDGKEGETVMKQALIAFDVDDNPIGISRDGEVKEGLNAILEFITDESMYMQSMNKFQIVVIDYEYRSKNKKETKPCTKSFKKNRLKKRKRSKSF